MLGLVFSEFLDIVDDKFGEETTDEIVKGCPLESGGAYSAVGTYDPNELHMLVGALSSSTGITADELQKVYGRNLFVRFKAHNPKPFKLYQDAFTFLEHVDREIHDDVRALYPNADLPKLEAERIDDQTMLFHYQSKRGLPSFCHGLIEGCLAYYGREATIEEAVDESQRPARHTFTIRMVSA